MRPSRFTPPSCSSLLRSFIVHRTFFLCDCSLGLSDLLAGQYGARFVLFVLDTADRVHVLHASEMKSVVSQLRAQLQWDLDWTSSSSNNSNSNSNNNSNSTANNSSSSDDDDYDCEELLDSFGEALADAGLDVSNISDVAQAVADSSSSTSSEDNGTISSSSSSTSSSSSSSSSDAIRARASTLSLQLVNVMNVGSAVAGLDVSPNLQCVPYVGLAIVCGYTPPFVGRYGWAQFSRASQLGMAAPLRSVTTKLAQR
jgi:hypothetical protein